MLGCVALVKNLCELSAEAHFTALRRQPPQPSAFLARSPQPVAYNLTAVPQPARILTSGLRNGYCVVVVVGGESTCNSLLLRLRPPPGVWSTYADGLVMYRDLHFSAVCIYVAALEERSRPPRHTHTPYNAQEFNSKADHKSCAHEQ